MVAGEKATDVIARQLEEENRSLKGKINVLEERNAQLEEDNTKLRSRNWESSRTQEKLEQENAQLKGMVQVLKTRLRQAKLRIQEQEVEKEGDTASDLLALMGVDRSKLKRFKQQTDSPKMSETSAAVEKITMNQALVEDDGPMDLPLRTFLRDAGEQFPECANIFSRVYGRQLEEDGWKLAAIMEYAQMDRETAQACLQETVEDRDHRAAILDLAESQAPTADELRKMMARDHPTLEMIEMDEEGSLFSVLKAIIPEKSDEDLIREVVGDVQRNIYESENGEEVLQAKIEGRSWDRVELKAFARRSKMRIMLSEVVDGKIELRSFESTLAEASSRPLDFVHILEVRDYTLDCCRRYYLLQHTSKTDVLVNQVKSLIYGTWRTFEDDAALAFDVVATILNGVLKDLQSNTTDFVIQPLEKLLMKDLFEVEMLELLKLAGFEQKSRTHLTFNPEKTDRLKIVLDELDQCGVIKENIEMEKYPMASFQRAHNLKKAAPHLVEAATRFEEDLSLEKRKALTKQINNGSFYQMICILRNRQIRNARSSSMLSEQQQLAQQFGSQLSGFFAAQQETIKGHRFQHPECLHDLDFGKSKQRTDGVWECLRCGTFTSREFEGCKYCAPNPLYREGEEVNVVVNDELFGAVILSKNSLFGKWEVAWKHDPTMTSWVESMRIWSLRSWANVCDTILYNLDPPHTGYITGIYFGETYKLQNICCFANQPAEWVRFEEMQGVLTRWSEWKYMTLDGVETRIRVLGCINAESAYGRFSREERMLIYYDNKSDVVFCKIPSPPELATSTRRLCSRNPKSVEFVDRKVQESVGSVRAPQGLSIIYEAYNAMLKQSNSKKYDKFMDWIQTQTSKFDEVVRIQSDGNCLYKCLEKAFEKFGIGIRSARTEIYVEMLEHRETYEPFLEEDLDGDIKTKLNKILTRGVWGGDLEITAFCTRTKSMVHTWSIKDGKFQHINLNVPLRDVKPDRDIHLAYVNAIDPQRGDDFNHYVLLWHRSFNEEGGELGFTPKTPCEREDAMTQLTDTLAHQGIKLGQMDDDEELIVLGGAQNVLTMPEEEEEVVGRFDDEKGEL